MRRTSTDGTGDGALIHMEWMSLILTSRRDLKPRDQGN